MKTAAPTPARILVIEDETSVAAFLRAALERRGYEVVASRSAAEALEMLAAGDFTGVISDLRTPGCANGSDVRHWLRSHRPQLATRMIFITGDTASPETAALLAREQVLCVEKPFRVHELIAAVESTIGKP
ncbi:MAG TPA: response regulator [Candidatus Acidoferrum sp.]|nr:response regulator [Candidatus Acidoferrum sp.]